MTKIQETEQQIREEGLLGYSIEELISKVSEHNFYKGSNVTLGSIDGSPETSGDATWIASVRQVDHEGDLVEPSGCIYDDVMTKSGRYRYMVFRNHEQTGTAIGMITDIQKDDEKIIISHKFSNIPEAQTVRAQLQEGMPYGGSIGFRALPGGIKLLQKGYSGPENEPARFHVTKWKFKEFSIVNFQINPGAEPLMVKGTCINSDAVDKMLRDMRKRKIAEYGAAVLDEQLKKFKEWLNASDLF